MIRFLSGKPAAVIGKFLLIGDLHFGVELELQSKGVNLDFSPGQYVDLLNSLAKETNTTELVVLGDFKNNYLGVTQRERNALNELFQLLKFKRVIVVKGNHDGSLEEFEKFFPKLSVKPASGEVLKIGNVSYGLFHGHAMPSREVLQSDYLLCGHQHPGVMLGSKKITWKVDSWIVGNCRDTKYTNSKQKFIVFPSFHELKGSTAINARTTIGPLFKEVFDLLDAEVILLNGQRVGKVKYLTSF